MSFLMHEAHYRLQKNSLIQINSLINWENLRQKMGNLGRSGYGPNGYDTLQMVKALILQAWHNLSDNELEEALRVRLDFMIITGLTEVPDETTICRFRNLITKNNLWEQLLQDINRQLEIHGLKVKESQGAIIDATIVESAARPSKELKNIPVDREEDDKTEEVQLSKDTDARWLKKGNKSYFGYKNFMIVDKEDGYIEHIHVSPANTAEVSGLEKILPHVSKPIKRLYADKGYTSENNKNLLKKMKIKNGIMEKAYTNKPLRHSQKIFNKLISKVRYRVEQGFGTLKRKFEISRASYFTLTKVRGEMILKAIAFNLLKALNKIAKFRVISRI